MRLAAALVLALAPLAGAASAQNWCDASGLNPTERTICADDILGDLDRRLNEAFRSSGESADSQRQWLARRNACGTDIFCIEAAYRERIAALNAPAPVPAGPLRPWCTASQLNPAEQTICGSELLANMDAAMGAVYGQAIGRPGDDEQATWLRGERDACGTDEVCIGRAYVSRIIELGGRLRAEGG